MNQAIFTLRRHWVWTQLRRHKKPFTTAQLLTECNKEGGICTIDRVALWRYLDFLKEHGYLIEEAGNWVRCEENDGGILAPIICGRICYDPNKAGPVLIKRQRIWNALRAESSALEIDEISRRANCHREICSKYLRLLERAEIIRGIFDSRIKFYEFCGKPGPYHLPPIQASKLFDQVKNTVIEL